MKTVEGYLPTPSGARLYYRRVGGGTTTVVIPLATWWGSQADRLADRMELVLYDPPGRGRSDPIAEDAPVGMDHGVAHLEAVRHELGLERISLVGWSYLGALVIFYATTCPDRVDRVVQVGPLIPRRDLYWEQWMADYSARAARLRAQTPGEASRSDGGVSEPNEGQRIRARRLAMVMPQLGDLSVATAIVDTVGTDLPNERPDTLARLLPRMMETLGHWDFRETARRVTAPVLTIHGSEDTMPLAGCREWVSVLPDARLLRLEGVGHYPFYECPDRFFTAVAAFLHGAWPEAAERP